MEKMKLITDDGKVSWVHVVSKRKSEIVSTFMQGISNAKTTLKKGHNVYVMPKSLITRDDMNYLKDEMNISQKRKGGTYDRIIISEKLITNLICDEWSQQTVKVNRALLIDALKYMISNYELLEKNINSNKIYWRSQLGPIERYEDFLNVIEINSTANDTQLAFDKSQFSKLYFSDHDSSTHPPLKDCQSSMKYNQGYFTHENYNEFQSLWKQRNIIVTEEYVKKLITSDNPMSVDTTMSIAKMLRGTIDDAELAVVTISKMAYRNHLDMLYYLASKYQSIIMDTKAINTAGCKDLKSAIRDMPWPRPDNLLENLRSKNQLSKEGLNLFLKDIANSISNDYKIVELSVDPQHLKLKTEFNEIRS